MAPRLPWLLVYVFANIIAAGIMSESGELIGDVAGNPLYKQSALMWATVLVVLSYLLMLLPGFHFISKIKIKALNFADSDRESGNRIGKLLIILQLGFMAFNLTTGVNVAGANNTISSNPLALLWVFVPPDALFVIYYGFYRENKFFYPNALIALISNLSRGWAGIFSFIIFFEWCRAVRAKKITIRLTLLIVLLIIVLYPLLNNLKELFRLSAGSDLSIYAIVNRFMVELNAMDYFSLMGNGILHLIGRLQVTSIVVEVMRMSTFLQAEFAHGKFAPFWMDGLHGIVFDRLFHGEKSTQISVAFTQYENFGWQFDVGDWNTNIGYVGWFFIAPYLIPLYILYTLFLGFLSFFFVKKIGISESSKDMLWLAWLVYLMPPWLNTFIAFIYALFVFLIIKIFLMHIPTLRLLPSIKFNLSNREKINEKL